MKRNPLGYINIERLYRGGNMTDSPFLYMKENSKTVLWNDSADPKELKDALTWGIVGATCNPVIALSALKADKDYWNARMREYAKSHLTATEGEIGWELVKELSINAAKILEPEFEKYYGLACRHRENQTFRICNLQINIQRNLCVSNPAGGDRIFMTQAFIKADRNTIPSPFFPVKL
jgi:hypothetical protein